MPCNPWTICHQILVVVLELLWMREQWKDKHRDLTSCLQTTWDNGFRNCNWCLGNWRHWWWWCKWMRTFELFQFLQMMTFILLLFLINTIQLLFELDVILMQPILGCLTFVEVLLCLPLQQTKAQLFTTELMIRCLVIYLMLSDIQMLNSLWCKQS